MIMETEPKLTEDQKKQIKTAAFKFLLKGLWNGIQHGVMGCVLSVLLTYAVVGIFDNDQGVMVIGSIGILVLIIFRMNACSKENLQDYQKEVAEIMKR
jgi:uncharacterized membrane protein